MSKTGPKKRLAARKTAPSGLWEGFSPPSDFDPEASAEFARLLDWLKRVGTLDRTAPRLVVLAARTHSLIERAHADIERNGMTLIASNGTAMPHPMLAT